MKAGAAMSPACMGDAWEDVKAHAWEMHGRRGHRYAQRGTCTQMHSLVAHEAQEHRCKSTMHEHLTQPQGQAACSLALLLGCLGAGLACFAQHVQRLPQQLDLLCGALAALLDAGCKGLRGVARDRSVPGRCKPGGCAGHQADRGAIPPRCRSPVAPLSRLGQGRAGPLTHTLFRLHTCIRSVLSSRGTNPP